MSRPVIAATLIVRNEERCLARCLASVAPHVDRIVVLDTGSTDATPRIAEQAGAELHHLAWPNDFAAARNHLLDLADADWALMLDADETLVAGGEAIRDWCAAPPRLGRIAIRSSFDQPGGGTATDTSWVTRLLPRDVRYTGRVHEQPLSDLPRERTAIACDHDGYRDVRLGEKSARNRPLLLLDLADRPGDPYIRYQLGRDAEVAGDHADAADWYERAATGTRAGDSWRHDLTVRRLHTLGQAGRAIEAMELAEAQMPDWDDSPDFFFAVGNLALDLAITEPASALGQWLPLATAAWERCLAIGDRPDLDGSVAGRGSFLARQNLDAIRSQLAG
ncbi:glycosyltransferase family 2 protein [Sphingomonas sp.]|uniref:glycosyltransferase family 2 protein n=1 Tax=Sphingomonas sp. TaxID=28214 RepID=UPI002DD65CC4|nr:glycosyltransferase family 2 protein [Sphingomonas sp.]